MGEEEDVHGLLSEDNPPGESNGEQVCHIEGNSALSLLGTEERTVGVPKDPSMVYYKWSVLGISGHTQGLEMPLHRGCGPHPEGGDKSLPSYARLKNSYPLWFAQNCEVKLSP